jgi:hypothetical protein
MLVMNMTKINFIGEINDEEERRTCKNTVFTS